MLVLTRKHGERILIGGQIEVTVLKISGSRVKLGITGPPHVSVRRTELVETDDETHRRVRRRAPSCRAGA